MTTNPLPWELLPDTAEIIDGRLRIGGCDVIDVAERFGTPVFIYDEEHLRSRCAEAVAVFGDGVAYASKAFLCKAMARLAYEAGMHIDVATGGEMYIALAADVPGEMLVLHGNNKSYDELETAMDAAVSRIVVDSFDEMDRIESLVAAGKSAPNVLLRINPWYRGTYSRVSTNRSSRFEVRVPTHRWDRRGRDRAGPSVRWHGVQGTSRAHRESGLRGRQLRKGDRCHCAVRHRVRC